MSPMSSVENGHTYIPSLYQNPHLNSLLLSFSQAWWTLLPYARRIVSHGYKITIGRQKFVILVTQHK